MINKSNSFLPSLFIFTALFSFSAVLAYYTSPNTKAPDNNYNSMVLAESDTLETVNTDEYANCRDVPAFLYHHVMPRATAQEKGYASINTDPAAFKNHMKQLLDKGYNPIFIKDLYLALNGQGSLPSKPVLITVDDGYADNMVYMFPIIRDLNIKVNLAITPYQIGRTGYIKWADVQAMHDTGLVRFYNHSYRHDDLRLKTVAGVKADILKADEVLKERGVYEGPYLIYPLGKTNNTVLTAMREAGYTMGFTNLDGSTQCKTNILKLYRNMVGSSTDLTKYGITLR